jgi:hypothetical protein
LAGQVLLLPSAERGERRGEPSHSGTLPQSCSPVGPWYCTQLITVSLVDLAALEEGERETCLRSLASSEGMKAWSAVKSEWARLAERRTRWSIGGKESVMVNVRWLLEMNLPLLLLSLQPQPHFPLCFYLTASARYKLVRTTTTERRFRPNDARQVTALFPTFRRPLHPFFAPR